MIVTDILGARAEIDIALVEEPGLADSVFRQLTRAIIAEGEGIGAFIGPNSTYMRRGKPRDGTFTIPFVAYWCPDPTLGVEFQGGANDGKVLPVPRGDDGRPFEQIRFAAEHAAPEIAHPNAVTGVFPVVPMNVGTYERVGIDSALDRWVYRHMS